MTSIYIDASNGSGYPVYGTTGQFKFNLGTSSRKRRRGYAVLHLAKAKPTIIEVISLWTAATDGTRVDPGEFIYLAPDQILRIENIDGATGIGIYEDPDASFAIPITYKAREAVVMTNVHVRAEPIE